MGVQGHKTATSNFTIVSNDIIRNPELSPKARWLLIYILSHSEEWSMTIGSIATLNRVGRTQIANSLKELKDAGYARVEQTHSKDGSFSENDWQVYDYPKFSKEHDMLTVDVKSADAKSVDAKQQHKNTNNKEDQLKELSATASEPNGSACVGKNSYTTEFENLWQSYKAPTSCKGTKKTAASRYKTLRKEYSADQIQDFMNHYLATRARAERSGEFIPRFPHLSTWITQGKWEDFGEYREGSSTNTIQRASIAPESVSREEVDKLLGRDNWIPPEPPLGLSMQEELKWETEQKKQRWAERKAEYLERMNNGK